MIWYLESKNVSKRKAYAASSFFLELRRFVFYKELVAMFEKEFEIFWEDQIMGASGQRLEMLHRDLTGTKILLAEVLFPVLER